MDNLRVAAREPILLLTRAADKFVSLKPGETIRAQVAEVLPGGEVNLRIQGNLFRAKSLLQLPQNANVLFRVVGQTTGEGTPEVRLQFLEVIAASDTGQTPQSPAADLLQTLTQELASNLGVKAQMPIGLAATVERLLKALPDNPASIPVETREQLLTLLQTSLRTTGQSIQNRLDSLLRQVMEQGSPPMRELADLKVQIFADIEAVSQLPLKSTLTNTGVGLEARLRVLAESLAQEGDQSPGSLRLALGADQSVETLQLPPELKAALVRLNEQGVPLPPELKEVLRQVDQGGLSLPQVDLKSLSLSPELKDALVRLNEQGVPLPPELKEALAQVERQGAPLQPPLHPDPLQSDFKARLLQIREMVLEQQVQLQNLDLAERIANAGPLKEKKAMLDQMLQSVNGLLQDVETFQLLSKLTDSFYTFLPFIWKGLKEADIAFKRSAGGPHGRSYYCLVHLDLEEPGKLEVVAMMAGSEFYVTFKTDNEQFRSVLNAHMNELEEMFAAKGLKLGLVSFHGMEEKRLAPIERLESFESLVDIRI